MKKTILIILFCILGLTMGAFAQTENVIFDCSFKVWEQDLQKTLQKINKQLNCNNMVKNTNNITYNIIGLGHENLTEVFTRKEKMAILKNRFYCLPELVEYTHFNDKYPNY